MKPRVLISYAYDPDTSPQVEELRERLERDGVECVATPHMLPEELWPRWFREQVDFVLVVCTKNYLAKKKWKRAVVSRELYEAECQHKRIIPVLFSPRDSKYVPIELKVLIWHDLSFPGSYDRLINDIVASSPDAERARQKVQMEAERWMEAERRMKAERVAADEAIRRPSATSPAPGRQDEQPRTKEKPRQSRLFCHTVRVFYGTDRKKCEVGSKVTFCGDRSETDSISLGLCDVSIPSIHRTGKLETPKWWKLEFRFNLKKHITLRELTILPQAAFYELLGARVRQSGRRDAFVFVHGFNVSFEDAARRTAQIAYDLDFYGAPIMFSWPSCAKVKGYPVDEATIDWVLPHLSQFLHDIVSRGEVRTLHLIAHSMGNRALARVLKDFALAHADLHFNQVLMAAPDVDRGEFIQLASKIATVSERITLYASSRDRALRVSQTLHGYPRAGDAGQNIVITPEIDTIDASEVDTDFLAHSYFCADRTLLNDIFYVVKEGKSPQERYGLSAKTWQSGVYWYFRR